MKYVKPRQLADAISVTTDALRKQRERGTSSYEYEVIEGRVLYDFITLPPSVRENFELTAGMLKGSLAEGRKEK